MKRIMFLLILALGFVSCEKENPQPSTPPSTAGVTGDLDQYVVRYSTSAITVDSVFFVNQTQATSEMVQPSNTPITCTNVNYMLARFPLSSSATVGDVCQVTIYHNDVIGPVPISNTVGDANTDGCDVAGWSGDQSSSTAITTLTFTIE